MSTLTSQQAPKFSWDCEVPETPFWKDLSWKDGRAFFKCFSPAELDRMTFDDGLAKTAKLEFISTQLKQKLQASEAAAAPATLQAADFKLWEHLNFGLAQLEFSKGNPEEQVKIYRQMLHSGPGGARNLSVVHDLSVAAEAAGNFAEAEALATDALSWIEGHEKLGPNTPQAVGACKVLAKACAQAGRPADAKKWVESGHARINSFRGTQFEKYEEETRQDFDEQTAALI